MNLMQVSEINILCDSVKKLMKLVKKEVWMSLTKNAVETMGKARVDLDNLNDLIVKAYEAEAKK